MKLFECESCGQPLYFENTVCESCGHRLGYVPAVNKVTALEPEEDHWRALGAPGQLYRFCQNAELDACNWLVPSDSTEIHCAACRHNRTIPDLSDAENMARWRKMELAKHHLFYTMIKLKLPLKNRVDDPKEGLAFDFLSDQVDADGNVTRVLTGHDNGLITRCSATSATRSAITSGTSWSVTRVRRVWRSAARSSATSARIMARR
jgi:hypothetical protein